MLAPVSATSTPARDGGCSPLPPAALLRAPRGTRRRRCAASAHARHNWSCLYHLPVAAFLRHRAPGVAPTGGPADPVMHPASAAAGPVPTRRRSDRHRTPPAVVASERRRGPAAPTPRGMAPPGGLLVQPPPRPPKSEDSLLGSAGGREHRASDHRHSAREEVRLARHGGRGVPRRLGAQAEDDQVGVPAQAGGHGAMTDRQAGAPPVAPLVQVRLDLAHGLREAPLDLPARRMCVPLRTTRRRGAIGHVTGELARVDGAASTRSTLERVLNGTATGAVFLLSRLVSGFGLSRTATPRRSDPEARAGPRVGDRDAGRRQRQGCQ